ncbi:invasion associated locus B family protein [Rhizobium ruizarguesonis]|uniref:invasion associated locus B family protein n=1 Tax=Rhizobium ruizarguesonis TaxID=2081791 RepID=UPI001030F84D|nr:invasion associated locus B family protein [Rhizobium ruizarguesonis]TAZ66883.1 invasion associated locus B family protein [Rhizobium ruizarguesonis]TAZ89956.1 invasion associated locus B family protein [Rhizobium ruizarguesonis]TBA10655.1 invasion associated locus B family protein [Rhizobium ruizarguesonis]TBA54051.1 invasion associated locus B family protein [Rhizobium ruizarguesonis]TBB40555.1 invasion associated locus B family protein [Rhizobium ruizarguesonis]
MRKFLKIGMKRTLPTIAPVLIFIACANPAFSQSAVPADQGPEQVQAPAQPAPAMKSQKFDDWYYRCTGSAGTEACEVAQVAQVAKDGKPVNILTLAIAASPAGSQGKGEKGKPRLLLTALLPLNVYLPSGLSIKADGKPVAKLDYRNCNQSGCWAQLALDTKTATALKKGSTAEGLVRLMNGQDVNIRFSLKGLKPALDELQPTAVK